MMMNQRLFSLDFLMNQYLHHIIYLSSIKHINTDNQIKLLEVRMGGKAKEIVEQEMNFCQRAVVGSQFTGYQ
jgi:hypothetical protein